VGSLSGVRVLELGNFIAGPFAGQLLADHGAEVLKVEAPDSGDPMRRWGVVRNGESLWWPSIARNKASVAVDLGLPEGRDVIRRLSRSVDVVLENFRPGTLHKWGLDYETLAQDHPGLIMVHVSGYGQTGPQASEPGFGSIGEAMGGLRYVTGNPGMPPTRCGISIGDSLASLFAVIGTLLALQERSVSGQGQEVDIAIYEAVAALMESTMADFEGAGVLRSRSGPVLAGVAPSNVYPTASGDDVVIAANADSVFARLCEAMGKPELVKDPRFREHGDRGANMAEIDQLIAEWTSTLHTDDLLDQLSRHKVPAGRIFTAPDMIADAQYAARDMVLRLTNRSGVDLPFTGVVPKLSRTPGVVESPGPELGSHTRAVLAELAEVGDDEWSRLVSGGVVA
jgi:formyl-CoA transferase